MSSIKTDEVKLQELRKGKWRDWQSVSMLAYLDNAEGREQVRRHLTPEWWIHKSSGERGDKKYFLDTEFIEDGSTIDLLSIGIVSDDGREFYAQPESGAWDKLISGDPAFDWVREHVVPQLQPTFQPRVDVREEVRAFCDPDVYGKPEFWGYYADYDWVGLCQLFGTMMDLPKGWPMYCRDIKQLCDDKGNPRLPEQGKGEHHALADAKWNKLAWEFLKEGV